MCGPEEGSYVGACVYMYMYVYVYACMFICINMVTQLNVLLLCSGIAQHACGSPPL